MWRAAVCVAGMMILLWTGVARAADVVENALGICASCHGADGLPKDPTVPIIWGQRAKYIEKQLLDYRSGDRDNQIMSSMAEAVRRDDVPPRRKFSRVGRGPVTERARDWPQPPSKLARRVTALTCRGGPVPRVSRRDWPVSSSSI